MMVNCINTIGNVEPAAERDPTKITGQVSLRRPGLVTQAVISAQTVLCVSLKYTMTHYSITLRVTLKVNLVQYTLRIFVLCKKYSLLQRRSFCKVEKLNTTINRGPQIKTELETLLSYKVQLDNFKALT